MAQKHIRKLSVTAIIWIVVALVVLTGATYAWFTSNSVVTTSRVEAHSGTASVELQISAQGGDAFTPGQEAAITQVNSTEVMKLMPVSTADLTTFFYSPVNNGERVIFRQVTDEAYFYHGRVYLRAVSDSVSGSRMAIYLDESTASGGVLAQDVDGQLLNAARLGLTLDGNDAVIFTLSENNNAAADQIRNTYLGGVLIADGNVLTGTADNIRAVADPAVSLAERTIGLDNSTVTLPAQPLFTMDLNTIYAVDIYFYLEGCDPDCSDAISFNAADLHLAFYGILEP